MIQLQKGSSGPLVEMLQLALTRAGYPVEISGDFLDDTQQAVEAYQRANGLAPDGIVGVQTWSSLEAYIKGYRKIGVTQNESTDAFAARYGVPAAALRTANPTLQENVQQGTTLTVPFDFPLIPDNIRYTGLLVSLLADGLHARYPFITTGSIGQSIMGQELLYLAIGTGGTEVFYNAEHHANEWITTPLVLLFAEDYARAVAEDGEIDGISAAALYQSKKLYIVPAVNPDGMDLVTGGIPDNDFYHEAVSIGQNYPSIPFPSGWKANIAGTDLNLNYPAGWQKAKENKFAQGFTSPAPRDFVGPAPLSAPESRAVYNFTIRHNFRLTLSYHTQGEVIYWKYLKYTPPRSYEIATALSDASGYALELTPYASGFAGYKDWFIQTYNLPGYTIEAGHGENPLPLSQLEEMYQKNRGIFVQALYLA